MPQPLSPESEAPRNEQPTLAFEAFLAADFEAPIADMTNVESYMLSSAYDAAAAEADKAEDKNKFAVYSFLSAAMGMHLRATDRATPWWPQLAMSDTRRTIIPTDIKPQIEQLLLLLPYIDVVLIKARFADLIWSNDKSQTAAAHIAIDSYSEIVTKLLNRTLHGYDNQSADYFEALRFLQRGIGIARAIAGKKELDPSIVSAVKDLYHATKANAAYVACTDTAEIGCRCGILDRAAVAQDLENLASDAPDETYPEAVRKAANFAAYLYGILKDEKGKERCELLCVSLLLGMTAQCSQAAAKASWVMDAIQALSPLKGHHTIKSELKKILRELQDDSTHEYGLFTVPMYIEDEREATHARFLNYKISEALKYFAFVSSTPSREKLHQEAIESIKSSPLLATMTMNHHDGDGKLVAKTEGVRHGETPNEEWFDTTITRNEGLRRHALVGAGIEPARQAIALKFSIVEEHIEPIVGASWLIPSSQKPIMALGFSRLLQGDFISAAHLLFPQLEPCLRHLLQLNGNDTSKRRPDSTEEDQDLGALFRAHRAELDEVDGSFLPVSKCTTEVRRTTIRKEPSMKGISIIGVDLAKRVFQIHGVDQDHKVVVQKQLPRSEVLAWFSKQGPCLVGMEACATAHYWAQEIGRLGHNVKLIPPIYVKAYVRRQKNDRADAAAICEAVSRPSMRFVEVKTIDQQAIQVLHRTRDLLIQQVTQTGNALRAHLAEFGWIYPQGNKGLSQAIDRVQDTKQNVLPVVAQQALFSLVEQIKTLKQEIIKLDKQMASWHKAQADSQRLATIPGVGAITASAIVAAIGTGKQFRSGREFAAWVGLVPRQNSSGGKERLGRISKKGNNYLRKLLVMGATGQLRGKYVEKAPGGEWFGQLVRRKSARVASVALANKMARVAWAVLTKGEAYKKAVVANGNATQENAPMTVAA